MKIILKNTVENLGQIGDVVNVKDGYFRNYLAPKNLAVKATKGELTTLEEQRKKIEKIKEEQRAKNASVLEKLNLAEIEIAKKVGEEGKLFGTVTAHDIQVILKDNLDIDIDRKRIHLKEHIKLIGNYEIPIDVFEGEKAILKISVVKNEE